MVLLLKTDLFNTVTVLPLFLLQKNIERRTIMQIYSPLFGIEDYILNFRNHFSVNSRNFLLSL